MTKISEFLKVQGVYQVFLHVALIALAIEVIVLAIQNRELKDSSNRTARTGIKQGEYFSLNGVHEFLNSSNIDSSKTQLIYLFTTTCPFCEKNLASWMEISAKSRKQQIVVIGISLDSEDRTKDYVKAKRLEFPVFIADDPTRFKEANRIIGVPGTVVRSRSGTVDAIWIGLLTDRDISELYATISKLYSESHNEKGGETK
mgnify:CR=1 FL=1